MSYCAAGLLCILTAVSSEYGCVIWISFLADTGNNNISDINTWVQEQRALLLTVGVVTSQGQASGCGQQWIRAFCLGEREHHLPLSPRPLSVSALFRASRASLVGFLIPTCSSLAYSAQDVWGQTFVPHTLPLSAAAVLHNFESKLLSYVPHFSPQQWGMSPYYYPAAWHLTFLTTRQQQWGSSSPRPGTTDLDHIIMRFTGYCSLQWNNLTILFIKRRWTSDRKKGDRWLKHATKCAVLLH